MNQLNISQLQNLWMRSPDERLASWRDFRIELQSTMVGCVDNIPVSTLAAVSDWWTQVPEVSLAIDPYNSETWPTVWEIICEGECCKYSRGLAMAYNVQYLYADADVKLCRIRDHKYNDEYMIAKYNGRYMLNSPHDTVVDLANVDFIEIRETWNTKNIKG